MNIRHAIALAILGIAASTAFACGTERWPVKVGTDNDSAKVVTSPTPATINQLSIIQAPINPNVRKDSRYAPTELATYEITAKMTVVKHEQDGDYHIVLADEKGRTMIVESADPSCAAGSAFEQAITETRQAIDSHFGGAVGRKLTPNVLVTVTGIGFFDRIHGQEGVAGNGIELHPLLSVTFHEEQSMGELRRRVRRREED